MAKDLRWGTTPSNKPMHSARTVCIYIDYTHYSVSYIMNGSFNIYKPSDTIDDMELCKTQPCFALEKVTGLCTAAESMHSHLHVYVKR